MMLVAAVVGLGFVALFLAGRRSRPRVQQEQLEVLRRLEGRRVTLGIGTRIIVPQTGTIELGSSDFSVTFVDTNRRAVPLADIRWVSEPDNGRTLGGPW